MAPSEKVRYDTKLVAMATSYLTFDEKIVKIGPVDTDIALLIKKKTLRKVKCIASRYVT